MSEFSQEEIDNHYQKLLKEAKEGGYFLNPDIAFTKELAHSLLMTTARYGYPSCPCRLADGVKEEDLDIICPCDYRDQDINDFGSCFCALYVSKEVVEGIKNAGSIPERRPVKREERNQFKRQGRQNVDGLLNKAVNNADGLLKNEGAGNLKSELPYPVWRCTVCGYLAARGEPPNVCPVCKVPKERFERFI